MDYSEYKALQALLFFGLPVVWCVWQLIVLNRPSADSDDSVRQQKADKTLSAPASHKIG